MFKNSNLNNEITRIREYKIRLTLNLGLEASSCLSIDSKLTNLLETLSTISYKSLYSAKSALKSASNLRLCSASLILVYFLQS